MNATKITIDLSIPAPWTFRHFWAWRGRRAFGLVLAVSPRSFAIGAEAIAGESKGLAIMVGPMWIGFATLKMPA